MLAVLSSRITSVVFSYGERKLIERKALYADANIGLFVVVVFLITASVQESLESHFKKGPGDIPIKPSAEFLSKIAVSVGIHSKIDR